MYTDKPNYGNTFYLAMWVVGALLAVQALAVAWVMISREPRSQGRMMAQSSSSPEAGEAAVAPAAGVIQNQPPTLAGVPELPQPGVATVAAEDAIKPSTEETQTTRGVGGEPVVQTVEPVPAPAESAVVAERTSTGEMEPVVSASSEVTVGEGAALAASAPLAADPKSVVEELRRASLTVPPVEDRLLGTLILVGEGHLENNNMAEAFGAFREVEKAIPDHPRILGALGVSFAQMGQQDKAAPYWDKLLSMGPTAAGDYFQIAGRQTGKIVAAAPDPLKSNAEAGGGFLGPYAEATPPEPSSIPSVVKIGEVAVDEKKTPDQGQQVSLRVVIDAVSSTPVVVDHLEVVVQFYDRVNDTTVDQSTAATSWLYPTEPYDWKVNGTEEVVVTYTQPVFTEEELRDLGTRKYHGYVIELYYNDQLQDMVAMPEDLAGLRLGAGTQPQNAAPAPATKGPDNALFPEF